MPKVMLVYGTRPEAIKMAPVLTMLTASPDLEPTVTVTGQHREMLDQVNNLFGIVPDHDLDIIRPGQELHEITERSVSGLTQVLREDRPDAVVVQGDTTTTMAAALAAFYEKIPVVHLEAGLRTARRYNPFPEEVNRRITTQLATLHLAPTDTSRDNLLHDGVEPVDVVVTGNTVIDALLHVLSLGLPAHDPAVNDLRGRRTVLVTSHRRESWGAPMARTAAAVARLAAAYPDVCFLLPAHLNPAVRQVLLPPLEGLSNVRVTAPLGYSDFAQAMAASSVILTDSGGVQEEAPSLGRPVLVLRETTERPEAVTAGTVRLVGTDEELIVRSVSHLLDDHDEYEAMAHAVNPYGDGKAAARTRAAIEQLLDVGRRLPDFNADHS